MVLYGEHKVNENFGFNLILTKLFWYILCIKVVADFFLLAVEENINQKREKSSSENEEKIKPNNGEEEDGL